MSFQPPPYTPNPTFISESFQGPPAQKLPSPQHDQPDNNNGFNQQKRKSQESPSLPITPMPSALKNPELSALTADVTSCSGPTLAYCPLCRTVGMTVTKNIISPCNMTLSIILMLAAMPFGILVYFLSTDVEHRCKTCDHVIGVKNGTC